MVVEVKYCGVCGMPSEYCEFGVPAVYEKCKKWMADNAPEYLPAPPPSEKDAVAQQVGTMTITPADDSAPQTETKNTSLLKGGVPAPTDGDVKILPGGKVKKKEAAAITITRTQRNKRKFVTTVAGLDAFGIKLAEASKLFGKKFACGASVVKTATGTEEIDVQGDVSDDMVDFIFEKWGSQIDKKSVYTVEDGKKSRATPSN